MGCLTDEDRQKLVTLLNSQAKLRIDKNDFINALDLLKQAEAAV